MGYKPAYIWNGTSWDQIGNQAVSSLDDYALLAPVVGQNITNTTLTSASLNGAIFTAPEENWSISASAVTTTTTVDYLTAQNWYYTNASTAGACTLNIRGNSTTTLNSILGINQSSTFSFAITTGASTPAYFNAVQIDGTASNVTVRWQYANTPTSGTTSGVDFYSFTVVKTAATPAYTVFASVARW